MFSPFFFTNRFADNIVPSSTSSLVQLAYVVQFVRPTWKEALRWLDWIFWGGYLPRLSFNYVGMSKDMGKRLPQLYYIKMKISYDLGFVAIVVAMAT